MADNTATETVVFEIDVSSYEKSLAELSTSINALKADQKALADQTKQGMAGAAEALEKTNAQLKVQQQQYRTTQSVLVGYIGSQQKGVDTQKLSNNSIQANRDLLKQLTAQYISTKNPSEAFAKQVKAVSDELKKQESAIGDTRRNVGNYAEGFKSAFNSITDVIPGMQQFKVAQVGINAAMEANPIGLVVAAIQLLGNALKYIDPLMDAIEQSTAGLTAGFGALVNGGNVVDAAKEAAALTAKLQELEDAENGVAIATAKYDSAISGLLLKLRNKNITQKEAAKISAEIAKLDKERLDNSLAQENELLDSNIKLLARKTGLQEYEVKAIVEAGKVSNAMTSDAVKRFAIESGLSEQEVIELDKKEREAQKIIANSAREKSLIKDDELKKELDSITKQIIKIEDIKKESSLLGEKLANRNDALDDKFKSERDKRLADEAKELDEFLKKKQKLSEDDIKKLQEQQNAYNKILAENEKQAADAIAAKSKAFNDQIAFNDLLTKNDIAQASLEIKNKEEKEKRIQEIQLNSFEKQLDAMIQFLDLGDDIQLQNIRALKLKIDALKEEIANPSEEKPMTVAESLGIDEQGLKETQGVLNSIGTAIQSVQQIVSAGFEIKQNEIEADTEAQIASVEASYGSEEEKSQKIKELKKEEAKKKYELEKSAFETGKAIQIVQAIISTAVGVINGLNAGFSLGPAGVVMGPVLAALAGATGAVQIGVIASQQPPPPPKFAGGVIGLDGAGTATSDSIDAKLSRGESVVTAKATRRFHRQLAEMEMAVGNTPNYNFSSGKFAMGVIGDGGFSTRALIDEANTAAVMQAAIIEGFKTAPQPVVSVVEINRVNSSRDRSIAVSEI